MRRFIAIVLTLLVTGLVGQVTGSRPASAAPSPGPDKVRVFTIPPTLEPGTRQLSVLTLKNLLQAIENPVAMPWAQDARYTAATATRVKRFQRYFGLHANGVVTPDTWQLLFTLADARIASYTHADKVGPGVAYMLGGDDGGITVGFTCTRGFPTVHVTDFTARRDALRFASAPCVNGEATVRLDADPARAPGLHTFHASGAAPNGEVTHLSFFTAGF